VPAAGFGKIAIGEGLFPANTFSACCGTG